MQQHSEFFRTRSYEVVHAVFRVAAVTSREGMRVALEECALGYFLQRDLASLLVLQDAVSLARDVGDMYEVNADVLLREIGVLRGLLEQQNKEIQEHTHLESTVSIADMFSEPPFSFADFEQAMDDFSKQDHSTNDQSYTNVRSPEIEHNESGNESFPSILKNPVKPSHINSDYIDIKSPEMSLEKSGKASFPEKHEILSEKKSGNGQGTQTSVERRERIISLLREKQFCHINDILEHIPEVSDRTIRYDIKALVDNKLVERIGNGGPSSYFRLKNIENV